MTARSLTWDRILAWRLRRQLLDPVGTPDALSVVRALCGVQAQVPSAAELAVAVRQDPPTPDGLAEALAEALALRTWAMRGTLHVLAPEDAGAFLSLVGAVRTWEQPAWQRNFGAGPEEVALLARTVTEVLDGRVLERDELIEEVAARAGHRELDEHLRSGWGALLKPLAWMGLLCNGPSRGNRVTFTSPRSWLPDWSGIPEPAAAARIAIPAYLGAYGPARPETFDAWLTRGRSRKTQLRRWFGELEQDGVLTRSTWRASRPMRGPPMSTSCVTPRCRVPCACSRASTKPYSDPVPATRELSRRSGARPSARPPDGSHRSSCGAVESSGCGRPTARTSEYGSLPRRRRGLR